MSQNGSFRETFRPYSFKFSKFLFIKIYVIDRMIINVISTLHVGASSIFTDRCDLAYLRVRSGLFYLLDAVASPRFWRDLVKCNSWIYANKHLTQYLFMLKKKLRGSIYTQSYNQGVRIKSQEGMVGVRSAQFFLF